MTPAAKAKLKFFSASPPAINNAIRTNKVVNEVIIVRAKTWFRESFNSTSELPFLFSSKKFSLNQSETTIESFKEYPTTANNAANTDKSKVKLKIEKIPNMIKTS